MIPFMPASPALPAAPGAGPPAPRPPDAPTRRLRLATLGLLAALIALGAAWELWLAPTGSGTLALKVVPLALGLLGVVLHRMYTYRWLALLVWLYMAEGLVRATSEHGLSQALAGAEVALALALFLACTAYIRHRLRRGQELSA